MSAGLNTHNLTGFGCPLHYIKAREIMQDMAAGETVNFLVNAGESTDEVVHSLQKDGYQCVIKSRRSLHNLIEAIK